MPGKRGADDDDYVPPSGAARGAKKHPVSEAVLRFATEKKGAKAGPFVNKIFESSLEGAEQKVQQLEEADAASAEGAQPLSIIADCLMMIVAWLFYFIKIEWLDERIMRQTTSQSIADRMEAMRAGSSMDYHGDENNDEDGLGDDDDDENDDDADGEEPPFGH